jgi:hypothetical protein
LKFKGKVENNEMQVGRLEIKLVDSLIGLHGHSLIICGHVQIGGGGGGLLQSISIKIFV